VKRHLRILALLAPLALAFGCSKAPADAAIKAAESAIDAARPLAEKFVPDQMKGLSDALADAKDKFGKGDYSGALAAAKDLPAKANDVLAAAKAKKDELTKAWDGLTKDVSASLSAVSAKVGELSAMKKLPKGMDKAKVEGAKAALDAANQAWGQAAEAAKADKWTEALKKAGEVKAQATEIMASLGMPGEPAPAK
jgi:aminopeptidase N